MLQTRTVEPGTLGLLKQLMAMQVLDPFFLVGGTALALQLGHRVSIDLDLFTPEPFDKDALTELMSNTFEFTVESEGPNILITYINDVKVDFVKMSYPILFPSKTEEGIRMLDLRDIAPMKLKAVTQRGSKKDFFDIFFLLTLISIEEMLLLFKEKFRQHEVFHVIKSLTYFEDAEAYPDPVVFDEKITWMMVKSEIQKAAKSLG